MIIFWICTLRIELVSNSLIKRMVLNSTLFCLSRLNKWIAIGILIAAINQSNDGDKNVILFFQPSS